MSQSPGVCVLRQYTYTPHLSSLFLSFPWSSCGWTSLYINKAHILIHSLQAGHQCCLSKRSKPPYQNSWRYALGHLCSDTANLDTISTNYNLLKSPKPNRFLSSFNNDPVQHQREATDHHSSFHTQMKKVVKNHLRNGRIHIAGSATKKKHSQITSSYDHKIIPQPPRTPFPSTYLPLPPLLISKLQPIQLLIQFISPPLLFKNPQNSLLSSNTSSPFHSTLLPLLPVYPSTCYPAYKLSLVIWEVWISSTVYVSYCGIPSRATSY